MKILETSDTSWIEELANLTTEMLSLLEHMEQGIEAYRSNGGRGRPDRYLASSSWPDAHAGIIADPIGRYNGYVREFQHRADRALRVYKEKLG